MSKSLIFNQMWLFLVVTFARMLSYDYNRNIVYLAVEDMSKQINQPKVYKFLQFNVAQLLKQPGTGTRTYHLKDVLLSSGTEDFVLVEPLQGEVKLIKVKQDVFVSGQLQTCLRLPCTRCLTSLDIPVSIEIEETFSPMSDIVTGTKLPVDNDADPATLIDEQHILDLTEVIRQELVIAQPSKILCQDKCLGLCPQCGQNKNEVSCTCTNDTIDSRWAGLLTFKSKIDDTN